MWHVYEMEYYSVTKKNGILTFATRWMDPEDTTLREIGQIKIELYDFTYMWNIKIKTNEQMLTRQKRTY